MVRVKFRDAFAVPAAVMIDTPPVTAPGITITTRVFPSLLMGRAATPPIKIEDGLSRLVPVMVTNVPTAPISGVNDVIEGWEKVLPPTNSASASIHFLVQILLTLNSHIGMN